MSNLKNHVQLIGNIGQDPTIAVLDTGKKVARFSLATNEHYKNSKGEKQTETAWHSIVAWGKLADIVENHTAKGKEIALSGKLKTRSYTDKDNQTHYITEVIADEILLLGAKPSKS